MGAGGRLCLGGLICLLAAALAAGPARANQTVTVPATANIFGAGHPLPPPASGGGAGSLPPAVGVSSGALVTFANVAGQLGCAVGSPVNGPDGAHGGTCGAGTDVTSVGGVAGLVDRRAGMFLAGVFLTGAEPQDPAPARLDFSTPGGLGEAFSTLAPAIGQAFFIGDGLTGTGAGATQQFRAPAGARRLFLGFVDAYNFQGAPGYYGDDTGSITAVVKGGSTAGAPVLGRSAIVRTVSGTVRVKVPGGSFATLGPASQIPVGSILDTTRGVVALTTATARPGVLQAGRFRLGIFQLLQAPSQRGLTELRLTTDRSACAVAGQARATAAARRKLSRRVLNRLLADAKGRFRTRGAFSSATVRGTGWGTIDRCDGTLTRVRSGIVTVRDFKRKKTVTLRAGQTYLAQP